MAYIDLWIYIILGMRAKSLSSPSPVLSGKSSPCPSYSGKSSPCSTVEETKTSRKKFLEHITVTHNRIPADKSKSPRMNIRDIFFAKPQTSANDYGIEGELNGVSNGAAADSELSKIPEEAQHTSWNDMMANEEINDESLIAGKASQFSQTSGFEDEYLTLQQWRDKYNIPNHFSMATTQSAVDHTISKLIEMENAFLEKQSSHGENKAVVQPTVKLCEPTANAAPGDAAKTVEDVKVVVAVKKPTDSTNASTPTEEKKLVAGPMKYSNVLNRTGPMRPVSTVKPMNMKPSVASRTPFTSSTSSTSMPLSSAMTRSIIATGVSNTANAAKKLPLKSSAAVAPHITTRSVASKPSTTTKPAAEPPINRNNMVPSNVTRRLATRSKTMTDMASSNRNRPAVAASLTQRERFGSSTSTLKASNEHITPTGSNSKLSESKHHAAIGTRKSEPRSMPKHNDSDDDGWLTVKARRRSSLHWANRFNQPTGYTSLPTLALSNTDDDSSDASSSTTSKNNKNHKEVKKVAKPNVSKVTKIDVPRQKPMVNGSNTAKTKATTTTHNEFKVLTKVQQTMAVQEIKSKSVKLPEKKSITVNSRPTTFTFVRPKSGLTGLKLTSLHKEYLKKERTNKIPVTNGLKSTDEPKISMNIQTNMTISPAMRDLYSSCMGSRGDGRDDTKYADDTEGEERDDYDCDEHQRKLLEEQECLERQILELQNTEIEIDTETDDADGETGLDLDTGSDTGYQESNVDDDENLSLEARYHSLLSDMSSGERIETLATLQAIVSRHPGRAQELHQKLSSPSRRRSLHETLKKYQAKQTRAQDMRDMLSKEKASKIQNLLTRVEDVKAAKQQLIDEKRLRMEERLQRYAENRTQYLKDKIRKAHDEEEKLKEIAFILNLEAQNKRLDMMEMRKEQEGRLQDLEQERQKRAEEKAAKEAAVERRRQELAKERQKRLDKMDETRREREQRVEQMQEEKEKMRQKIAKEKVR